MASRPYLKFLIAGGIVTAEGGSCLLYGLEFMISNYATDYFSNILNAMAIGFTAAGIASLIIGLTLLYKGVTGRNAWLRQYPPELSIPYREIRLDGPERWSAPPETATRHFCPCCGIPLPAAPNIKFCPKCGESLYG